MGSLGRIKRVLQAAIGDLVERANDPELELARFVEDTELSLGEVRAEREDVRVQRDQMRRQAERHRVLAAEWLAKAEAAAARDDDEAARLALKRHREEDDEAASCAERRAQFEESLAILDKDEAELAEKLRRARREQQRVSAHLRRAEAEARAGAALGATDGRRAADAVGERAADEQATGEALREVHAESPEALDYELRRRPPLEDELAALKQRVKKKSAGT